MSNLSFYILEYLGSVERSQVQDSSHDPSARLSAFKSFLSDSGFPDGLPRDAFSDLGAAVQFKISKLYLPSENFILADLVTSESQRGRLFSLLKSIGICYDASDNSSEGPERPQKRQRPSSEILSSQVDNSSILTQLLALATQNQTQLSDLSKTVAGLLTTVSGQSSQLTTIQQTVAQLKKNVTEQVQYLGSVRKANEYFRSLLSNLEISDHAPQNEFVNQSTISEDRMQRIWTSFCQQLETIKRKKVHIHSSSNKAGKNMMFGTLLKGRHPTFEAENLCQAFLNEVFRTLLDLLPERTVDWRDTSLVNAPTNPLHLFDASFVCKSSGSSHQNFPVSWSDIVLIAQFKKDRKLFEEGLCQILDGIAELCLKQTYFDADRNKVGRKSGFGVVTDGASICFLKYTPKSKEHELEIIRSKIMPLFPNNEISSQQPISDGFKFLVHLLLSDHETLHFVAPRDSTLPDTDLVPDGANVRAHRLNDLGKPDIFFVKPQQEAEASFAIKRYLDLQQFHDELKCYQLSNLTAEQKSHFPELVGFDPATKLISMRPLAQSTLSDGLFSIDLLREVIQAGLQILPLLHSHHKLHGDISPTNLLVRREGLGLPPRVVLNDFSETSSVGEVVRTYFGTRHYSSIRMDQVATLGRILKLDPIDDWQSFAIVLLEFCIARPSLRVAHRLPWDTPSPAIPMFSHKRAVLTSEIAIRDLLGGGLLDDVCQSLLVQFVTALFQHDYTDLVSAVAVAIRCLETWLNHLTVTAASANVFIVRDDLAQPIYHANVFCVCRLRQGLTLEAVSVAQVLTWEFTPCPKCVNVEFVAVPDAEDLLVEQLARQEDSEVAEEL